MSRLRHIVLDVLKPHNPPLVEITTALADLEGVDGANTALMQVEKDVEKVKVTIKGESIDFDEVRSLLEENSCSIHSVDKVSCGSEIIRDSPTPQD